LQINACLRTLQSIRFAVTAQVHANCCDLQFSPKVIQPYESYHPLLATDTTQISQSDSAVWLNLTRCKPRLSDHVAAVAELAKAE
jgi:hypothetical protein